MEATGKHPIKAVARRTGLTAHVIRAWEKRYKALEPQRTVTNRRLYSDTDIDRLTLLKRATETGHNIGQIAALPDEELQKMISTDNAFVGRASSRNDNESPSAINSHIQECLTAIEQLDGEKLDLCLRKASVAFSQPVLLEDVIVPLMRQVGGDWAEGRLRVAHEHLASAMVRNFLGTLASGYRVAQNAPAIVIGTTPGQVHELGGVFATVTALAAGWKVVYLGVETPASEFAMAVQQSQAQAVGISIIYPPDDPRTVEELRRLRQMLTDTVEIIVGGESSASYTGELTRLRMFHAKSLSDLRQRLDRLRGRNPEDATSSY